MEAGVALKDRLDVAEGPWELPQGWSWATLDSVVEPVPTTDPRKFLSDQPFHYIDLGAIQQGTIVEPQTLVGRTAPSRARQLVRPGDTLFSCVRVYLRNIAIVRNGLQSPIASTAFCVLRPSAAVDPDYLHYFVQSRRFIEWMTPLQRGNSPPAVLDADVRAQLVPLPPLREQLRIAAQTDELFAEIAEGERALAEARKGLEKFRRALLKAAVTGELTKDWREANTVNETGHDVLARISKSRDSQGRTAGRGHRTHSTAQIDTSTLPSLPSGWAWTTLDTIVDSGPTNGYSPKKSTDGSGTLALKLTATTKGRIDLSDRAVKRLCETISADSDLFLRPRDLLFQRGNTVEYVGIAAIYEGPTATYVYPDLMIRVRTNPAIDPEWVWRVANSPFGRKYMSDRATGTAGTMPKISGSILRNFPIPIPPPAEATEIIRRVSDSLAAADDVQTILDAEAADAARLKQSILKAAFEGQLVPQNPVDEPVNAPLRRMVVAGTSTTRQARGRPRKGQ